MSSGITRKPLGRPRARTATAAAAALLEQRRDGDRARRVAHIERVVQTGGRLIGPVLLDGSQAAALELITQRDGCGIADAVRAALVAYAGGRKRRAP